MLNFLQNKKSVLKFDFHLCRQFNLPSNYALSSSPLKPFYISSFPLIFPVVVKLLPFLFSSAIAKTSNSTDASSSIPTPAISTCQRRLRTDGGSSSSRNGVPSEPDGDGDWPVEATGYHRRPKPWKLMTILS
ncbi:hypothetical protein EUGRSUZ_E02535 [Eucalyptus grandis]|uniref:Uncharacterized protein n=2 Tax=Eucalyptus grandis TaxID=71139 RepID=A0ACC3KXV1_EUCGR|nr:hypothetical protein EUGRSUZ_E02535 [Eucalyptus grandis]